MSWCGHTIIIFLALSPINLTTVRQSPQSMHYSSTVNGKNFNFGNLRILMAKASPRRAADELTGLAAESEVERAIAQQLLAEVPLRQFFASTQ
jgi:hypothetical protein